MKNLKIGTLVLTPKAYLKILAGLFFIGLTIGALVASGSFTLPLIIPIVIGMYLVFLGFKHKDDFEDHPRK